MPEPVMVRYHLEAIFDGQRHCGIATLDPLQWAACNAMPSAAEQACLGVARRLDATERAGKCIMHQAPYRIDGVRVNAQRIDK